MGLPFIGCGNKQCADIQLWLRGKKTQHFDLSLVPEKSRKEMENAGDLGVCTEDMSSTENLGFPNLEGAL